MANNNVSKKSIFRSADFMSASVLLLLSAAGYATTLFGKWSRGAGGIGGAKLFPRVSAAVVFITACFVLAGAFRKKESPIKLPEVSLPIIAVFFALGGLCIWLTIKLGVVTGSMIYMIAAFLVLSAPAERSWRSIVLPAALMAVANWILFVKFGQILINPLLF